MYKQIDGKYVSIENYEHPTISNYHLMGKSVLLADGWIVGNPPVAELSIDQLKAIKIAEITSECESEILGGFYSDAKDGLKFYKSTAVHQDNIAGQVLMANAIKQNPELPLTVDWKAADEDICYPWEPDEMITLGIHLQVFVTGRRKTQDQMVVDINACENVGDIEEFKWVKKVWE